MSTSSQTTGRTSTHYQGASNATHQVGTFPIAPHTQTCIAQDGGYEAARGRFAVCAGDEDGAMTEGTSELHGHRGRDLEAGETANSCAAAPAEASTRCGGELRRYDAGARA